MPLLKETERSVEYQEPSDDRSFDILLERGLEDDRGFEHPWNRRPKFGQPHAPCWYRGIRHFLCDLSVCGQIYKQSLVSTAMIAQSTRK